MAGQLPAHEGELREMTTYRLRQLLASLRLQGCSTLYPRDGRAFGPHPVDRKQVAVPLTFSRSLLEPAGNTILMFPDTITNGPDGASLFRR